MFFLEFLNLLFFCFLVVMWDLVQNVEAIFHIFSLLTEAGSLF